MDHLDHKSAEDLNDKWRQANLKPGEFLPGSSTDIAPNSHGKRWQPVQKSKKSQNTTAEAMVIHRGNNKSNNRGKKSDDEVPETPKALGRPAIHDSTGFPFVRRAPRPDDWLGGGTVVSPRATTSPRASTSPQHKNKPSWIAQGGDDERHEADEQHEQHTSLAETPSLDDTNNDNDTDPVGECETAESDLIPEAPRLTISPMRPTIERGHSFDDDRFAGAAAPRGGKRQNSAAAETEQDELQEAPRLEVSSLRPTTERGHSFDKDSNPFPEASPRGGKRPSNVEEPESSDPSKHEEAVVKTDHIVSPKKNYQWEKPVWAKQSLLKATKEGEIAKTVGNLAKPAVIPASKSNAEQPVEEKLAAVTPEPKPEPQLEPERQPEPTEPRQEPEQEPEPDLVTKSERPEYSKRPNVVRGMSFDSVDSQEEPPTRRSGKRPEKVSVSEVVEPQVEVSRDDIPEAPRVEEASLRPQTVRGHSFDKDTNPFPGSPPRGGKRSPIKPSSAEDSPSPADIDHTVAESLNDRWREANLKPGEFLPGSSTDIAPNSPNGKRWRPVTSKKVESSKGQDTRAAESDVIPETPKASQRAPVDYTNTAVKVPFVRRAPRPDDWLGGGTVTSPRAGSSPRSTKLRSNWVTGGSDAEVDSSVREDDEQVRTASTDATVDNMDPVAQEQEPVADQEPLVSLKQQTEQGEGEDVEGSDDDEIVEEIVEVVSLDDDEEYIEEIIEEELVDDESGDGPVEGQSDQIVGSGPLGDSKKIIEWEKPEWTKKPLLRKVEPKVEQKKEIVWTKPDWTKKAPLKDTVENEEDSNPATAEG